MARTKPTFVSLFSGGGGLDLGLKNAGFLPLFACDCEPSSAATFGRNVPDVPFHLGDIRHLSKAKITKALQGRAVDLVAGGSPCQGFSTLGDQNPADARNNLFACFARIVRWIEPTCFLLENVGYLRSQYGGRFEREILETFESLGYTVAVTTLNAADFGVPQNRRRAFFFGSKKNSPFAWPEPTHGPDLLPYVTVGEALKGLGNSSDIANHVHLNHSDIVVRRYKLIPEGGRMPPPSLLPADLRRKNFGNTYKRLHRDKPSLTLVPGNNAFPVHPVENRSLSAREAARLQTFPDEFIFFGTRAEQCRLVGNAVPPALGQRIGESIRAHLHKRAKVTPSLTLSQPVELPFVPERVGQTEKRSGLTAVSFFTGIGGLMLGFQNAGFDVLASYDLKNSVERNASVNFPSVRHYRTDISTLGPEEVSAHVGGGEIDVAFGGPPCQGFSIFGRRRFVNTKNHRADEDDRNELTIKWIDLVVGLKPKVIFFENVRGFASTLRGDGTYLAAVTSRLHAAGYLFKHEVVNCVAYGVPQSRERFILVAWKPGLSFVWPSPKHFLVPKAWQRPAVTVGDVISDLMEPSTYDATFSHVPMDHKPLVVERYRLIPEGRRLPDATLPEALRKGYRSDNVKNYSHVYKRLSMSMPATTMVPGHNAFPVHPLLHRTLTVREAARIQTFPDFMRFQGTRQQQCTLVGNAVPPALAEVFACNIMKAVRGNFASQGYKRDIYDLATA